MSNSGESVVVGLGEIKVSKEPSAVLTCLGLGSCIGVSAFDSRSGVAGMAHIVLPDGTGRQPASPKYANWSVPILMDEMKKLGASARSIVVNLAGGAQMSLAPGLGGVFNIGERNLEATLAALKNLGLRVSGNETGGNKGRTLKLYVGTGEVTVSTAGSPPKDL